MKKCSRLLSALMIAAVALALLTGSIAAPIIIRPFYYAQIEPLELEQSSSLSREEIIEAYDEVLDYCIGASDEFSAGVLPFSESGSAHFADCRTLRGHGAAFWGAAGIGAVLLVIGAAAATNFDRAFTMFHSLFFPSKDNWIFDPALDPIITLMPEEFFRNCAILILAVLIAACAATIIADKRKGYAK